MPLALNFKPNPATGRAPTSVEAANIRNVLGVLTAGEADSRYLKFIPTVPASSSAPGTANEAAIDGSFLYMCIATDTWIKIPFITSF